MATGPATQVSSQILSAVQQYQTDLQSEEVTPIQTQETTLNARISALGTLTSKLQTLSNTTKAMAVTNSSSTFLTLTASSSLPNIVAPTASSSATSGTHSILVTQLANVDEALSDRISSAANSIVTAEGAGTKTIQVGNQSVDVVVSAGDSNTIVLANIAAAINLKKGNVVASVVTDTSSTSRLVLKSTQTGSTNAVTLSDTTGTLLSNVGLSPTVVSSRTAFNATTGGFMKQDTSLLDSNFELDGIDMVRPGNTVTDALSGVTLALNAVQSPTDIPATINIGINTNQAQSTVQQFITNYNAVLSYLSTETSIDPTTNTPQIFAGQSDFTMLQVNLQTLIFGQVSSAKAGNPQNLFQIGITPGTDGTLSISDSTKFNAAMAADPTEISDLFNSSDGIAVQLNTLLKTFVAPTTGRMNSLSSIASSQLTSLNARIKTVNAQITIQTAQYQNELVLLQSEYETALAQQQEMTDILSGNLYSDSSSSSSSTSLIS